MSNTVVSLSSLLKRTMRSSDGQVITRPISGRMSAVLDSCGTARKLSDNFGRVKLYVYDANVGDVVRDEKDRPYAFDRQYKNLSVKPWLRTDTGHESNAQVKHTVVHCDVLRDEKGDYLLNADGTRQFKWSVVPDTFVWIADAEHPELQGIHQFGDTFESIVLEAQTKGADLVPASEDEDAEFLAEFDLERA